MSTPTDRPAPSIVTRLVAVNAVTVVGLILLLLLTPATITYPARPVEVLWVAMATVAVLVPSEWLLVRTLQDERRRAAAAVIGSEEATRRRIAAYRVAQEAITNVVRHAGATRLELAAGRRGHAVELTVTDDGHGGVRNQGFGITGMRERALAAGGRLEIDSDAGGTTVRLVLPVALERGGPRP